MRPVEEMLGGRCGGLALVTGSRNGLTDLRNPDVEVEKLAGLAWCGAREA